MQHAICPQSIDVSSEPLIEESFNLENDRSQEEQADLARPPPSYDDQTSALPSVEPSVSLQPSSDESSDPEDSLEFDDFLVYGEDGGIFDARRHRYMKVWLTKKGAVADMRLHAVVAQLFGMRVEALKRKEKNFNSSKGVPVNPK